MNPFENCTVLYKQYFEVCPEPELFSNILANIEEFVDKDPLQRFKHSDLPQLCENYLKAAINIWTMDLTEVLKEVPDSPLYDRFKAFFSKDFS